MHSGGFFDRLDLLLQILSLILSARVTTEETNLLGLVVHSMRPDVVSAIGDLPHFFPMVNRSMAGQVESRLDVILLEQVQDSPEAVTDSKLASRERIHRVKFVTP